jgi:hypothetical protein
MYSGEAVIRFLIPLLANPDDRVSERAERRLLHRRGGAEKALLKKLLREAKATDPDAEVRTRCGDLLAKMSRS